MAKKVENGLKLYVKPEPGKALGDLQFVWLTSLEISEYTQKGYIRAKSYKGE